MKLRNKKLLNPNTFVLLKQIGIGLLVFAVVGLLITAIWYGTRIQSLTITTVTVSGGETISHAGVEEVAKTALEGQYIGLIPRRFAWLYPRSEIRQTIEKFERIYNVSVSRTNGTSLSITFDEYRPYALWCSSATGTECMFIDSAGYAFGHAPNLSGGSFLRFVTIGRQAAIGEEVLEQETFNNLLAMTNLLASSGWFVSRVEVDSVGDAFLKITGGGELKVLATEPAEQIVENLLVVLASDDFPDIKPGNFQYIDLRFGNKVFVNEEMVAPETETIIESDSNSAFQIE